MGKTKRAAFDRKRQRAVAIQFKLGRTVAELKRAVDGCKLDPFSMGQNERAQEFNEFCLIFRDAAHVEKFMAIADAAQGVRPGSQLIANADPAKLRADASAERRKLETRRLLDQQAEQGKRISPEEAKQRLADLVAKVGKRVDQAE